MKHSAPPLEIDDNKPTRDYAASQRYEVGEQVAHPAFGAGIVEESDEGKVTIAFRDGRRVLAQHKASAGAGLARPGRIDHSLPTPGSKRQR
ncbi:hypothetical protein BH11MYX1_BH11MYX1_50050 [soil metagenome]